MFCDIEPLRPVWVVVAAAEELAEDGVVPVARAGKRGRGQNGTIGAKGRSASAVKGRWAGCSRLLHALGLDMPPREVVLQHAHEALFGVVAVFGTGHAKGVRERSIWTRGQGRGAEVGSRAVGTKTRTQR